MEGTETKMKSDPEKGYQLGHAGDAIDLYDENNPEHTQLRRVPGPLPWQLFMVCVIEMGERFVYNGLSAPLQNYIQ